VGPARGQPRDLRCQRRSRVLTTLLTWIRIAWSNLVFRLKCRAGFRLLEPVEVTGVVRFVEASEDGDTSFDLVPDGSVSVGLLIYGTSDAIHHCESIHCEIVPRDRARLASAIAALAPGVRVKVSGQRAWDGCHHGKGVLFNVLMVLLGAAPVLDGWLEVHPVTSLEVLL
jgi:hypothetical protein